MRYLVVLYLALAACLHAQTYDYLDLFPYEIGNTWTLSGTVTGTGSGLTLPVQMSLDLSIADGGQINGESTYRVDTDGYMSVTYQGRTITESFMTSTWEAVRADGIYTVQTRDSGGSPQLLTPAAFNSPRMLTLGQPFTAQLDGATVTYTPTGPHVEVMNGVSYELVRLEGQDGPLQMEMELARGLGPVRMNVSGSVDGTFLSGTLYLEATNLPTVSRTLSNWLWEGTANLGDGWRWSWWFGSFFELDNGWVYSLANDWTYPLGDADNLWLYSANDGDWLWTAQDVAPFFYSSNAGGWVYRPSSD